MSDPEATNQAYGFATGDIGAMRRIAVNTAYAKAQGAYEYDGKGIYWLRTQYNNNLKAARTIRSTGYITYKDVNNTEVAVRPALNINLDSVVLVSSYNVGKSCGETGSILTAVEDNGSNNSWKVTVKDSLRSGFIVKRVDSNESAAGSTIRVRYQNAKYGDNEYVSAIITDAAGNVLYYGHIVACDKAYKAGGEADIVIPAGVPSGFKIYVFNEQCNESAKTDYASELKDVTNSVSSVQNPSLIHVNNSSAASIQGGQASNVYFGNYQQTSDGQGGFNVDPIRWRVLENANNQLVLLSDKLLNAKRFDDNSNDWLNSDIYEWLNGNESGDFFKTAFAEKEQSAVVSSTDPGKIFLLSGDELQNSNYAFTDNGSRIALNTAYTIAQGASDSSGANSWWLRTPGSSSGRAACVVDNGQTNNMPGFDVTTDSYGVRPAFRIDLNSVVFASPAVGGKVSEFTGSVLNKVGDIGGNIDWKLTLKDPSRANFTATRIDYNDISAGTTIRIQYSNAKTGVNEYVSAIITDAAGKVIYYGNIDRNSSMRAVNIEIPADVPSEFKVYVFSEQCNGDRKTDYASNLIDVTNTGVTPPKMINFVVQHSYAVDADNIIGGQISNVYFGRYWQTINSTWTESNYRDQSCYDVEPIKWRVLGNGPFNMFLLSDKNLASVGFDYARNWINTEMVRDAFTSKEKDALNSQHIDNSNFEDKIAIPHAGVFTNIRYGFALESSVCDPKRIALHTDYERVRELHKGEVNNYNGAGIYHLRYPTAIAGHMEALWTGMINEGAGVRPFYNAIRPVAYLNLNSIVITSAAEGGKNSGTGGLGTLNAIGNVTEIADAIKQNDWKLTLLDTDRSAFAAVRVDTGIVPAGDAVKVSFTGAATGTNEYVSVFLVSASDENDILYYGHIANNTESSEGVDVTIPSGLASGDYVLKVFSEQVNEGYETDLASDPNSAATRIEFTVGKYTPTADDFVVTLPTNLEENGIGKTATAAVKTGITGMGDITVNYYNGDTKLTFAPTEPGTYTVKLDVAEGTRYNAATDLTKSDWAFTIVPGTAFKNIIITEGGIASFIRGEQKSNVYFGKYKQTSDGAGDYNVDPIKWRVLSNSEGKLLLLSDKILDGGIFDDIVIEWRLSYIRTWIKQRFEVAAFSTKEMRGVAETPIVSQTDTDSVFLLSKEDLINSEYGFSTDYGNCDIKRTASNTEYAVSEGVTDYSGAGIWWTRTHGTSGDSVVNVHYFGYVNTNGCNVDSSGIGMRPALNLKLSSTVFVSAAEGGKNPGTGGLGTLNAIGYTDEITDVSKRNDWKLTLLDSDRSTFTAARVGTRNVSAGEKVKISFNGAKEGANEYVSVFLVSVSDESNILYYGHIANDSVSSEGVDVTIPAGLSDGNYILKVFSEQVNGEYATDFASNPNANKIYVVIGEIEPVVNDITIRIDNGVSKAEFDAILNRAYTTLVTFVNGAKQEYAVNPGFMSNSAVQYASLSSQFDATYSGINGYNPSSIAEQTFVLYGNVNTSQYNGVPENPVKIIIKVSNGKLTPTADDFIVTFPGKTEYDGNPKTVTVTVKNDITGMGAITVNYYNSDGIKLATAPSEVGVYTIKIDVAEGTDYTAAAGLTKDSWTFTITEPPAPEPPEPPTPPTPDTKEYKVTFDANGGTYLGSGSIKVEDKKEFGFEYNPDDYVREGYFFAGWYTAPEGGTRVYATDVCTGNITLYAHWTKVFVGLCKDVSVKSWGKRRLTITWNKPVTAVSGYEVEMSHDGKNWYSFSGSTRTVRYFLNLTSGKKYFIRVRAYRLDSAKKRVYGARSKVYTGIPK